MKDIKPFKANYKRCFKCEEKESCDAMCVDVLCDEVKDIDAQKKLKAERTIEAYEYWRHKKIANSCHWKYGKRGLH